MNCVLILIIIHRILHPKRGIIENSGQKSLLWGINFTKSGRQFSFKRSPSLRAGAWQVVFLLRYSAVTLFDEL